MKTSLWTRCSSIIALEDGEHSGSRKDRKREHKIKQNYPSLLVHVVALTQHRIIDETATNCWLSFLSVLGIVGVRTIAVYENAIATVIEAAWDWLTRYIELVHAYACPGCA